MRRSVIVTGAVAQRPRVGGHTWVFLQYLLGFRRLGWDVTFIDRLEPGMCVDEAGRPAELAASANLRYLRRTMDGFGLTDSWSLLYDGGRETAGLPREELVTRARQSTLLINVMGYLDDEEILAAAPLRVLLDIDPGFGQMWQELGLHSLFQGHDRYVTIGSRIGMPDCAIPTCGVDWVTTLPPVELTAWPATPLDAGRDRFTSINSWRGTFGPVEYGGRTYGLRVHEFRRFLALPARAPAHFEIALDIDKTDGRDSSSLRHHGWAWVDPLEVAGDPWRYREYVQRSAAELMIAKHMYVATRGGWFSDRSGCYLASGRPVLAQDTGISELLPCGEGLLTFTTLDEAVDGANRIISDYDHHSRAARKLAEEHLAAQGVLPRLLDSLGVT